MPSADLLIAFLAATAIFAYIPGPAMLYATAQTIARGQRAGWLAALGLHTGGYVHVFAAAFGLAVLFEAVPVLYLVLKFAGAAYLLWLGARMILQTRTRPDVTARPEPAPSRGNPFWQSVTVEVLNPKTALFFLAFLPQFTDPSAAWRLWAQFLILGTVVNLMFSTADVACVVLADRVSRAVRASGRGMTWAQRVGGATLIGLGTNLALRP